MEKDIFGMKWLKMVRVLYLNLLLIGCKMVYTPDAAAITLIQFNNTRNNVINKKLDDHMIYFFIRCVMDHTSM